MREFVVYVADWYAVLLQLKSEQCVLMTILSAILVEQDGEEQTALYHKVESGELAVCVSVAKGQAQALFGFNFVIIT